VLGKVKYDDEIKILISLGY